MSKALDTLYKVLDFQSGSLLTASDKPTSGLRFDDWLVNGWLRQNGRALTKYFLSKTTRLPYLPSAVLVVLKKNGLSIVSGVLVAQDCCFWLRPVKYPYWIWRKNLSTYLKFEEINPKNSGG